jgi:hypothetical protein
MLLKTATSSIFSLMSDRTVLNEPRVITSSLRNQNRQPTSYTISPSGDYFDAIALTIFCVSIHKRPLLFLS